MLRRTTITNVKGLVTKQSSEGGLGVAKDPGNSGFSPSPLGSKTFTAAGTLTTSDAGIVLLTMGSEQAEVAMPTAAESAGMIFTFKTTNTNGPILVTGSAETRAEPFTDGTDNGFKVAMSALTGSSVSIISDGANFLIVGQSGSLTIS